MSSHSRIAFEVRGQCPACESSDFNTRFACRFDEPPIGPFVAAYYEIDPSILEATYQALQCRKCGSWFQGEVGNPALLERLYSEWVFDVGDPMRDPQYTFDITHPRLSRDGHQVMAAAAALGLPLHELKTLDFGMGWASWARISASLGCQSFGHDLAPDRMAYAAEHGVAPHRPGNRYHFINTEQVFEHLTDPLGTVRMLADALLPDGILKVSLPSSRGLNRLFRRLAAGQRAVSYAEIMPLQPLEHVNCFSRAGLKALGERVGLRVGRPPVGAAYAFLRRSGTLDPANIRNAVKELIRPVYQLVSPSNHYVWMRKSS